MAEGIQRDSFPLFSGANEAISGQGIDFHSLYHQYRLTIYRYALAHIGHVEDAQDITAQVFLKAYQNAASYRRESPIIYWLIGIARNQIRDYYRGRKLNVSLSDYDCPSTAPSLEESIEQSLRLKRISEVLNALSEDRREALAMRLFAGLSNQEIAKIMGKSPDAVAMLVHRAIQDLKSRLGEDDFS